MHESVSLSRNHRGRFVEQLLNSRIVAMFCVYAPFLDMFTLTVTQGVEKVDSKVPGGQAMQNILLADKCILVLMSPQYIYFVIGVP